MTRAGAIMHGLAVLILVLVGAWGAALYPQLPEAMPTHWNAAGEADAFQARSVWSAFGPLLVAGAMVLLMLALHHVLGRTPGVGPSERRTYDLVFGYLNLSLAGLFGWTSLMSWYDLELGPLFLALALLAGLPVLVIMGVQLPAITRERKARSGPEEPSLNPDYWLLGGFLYSNPDDPRVFVPKPPHTGLGMTMNLATTGGRLLLGALALVIVGSVALPFVLG